jgi:isocitrate/isopropylmalate dehydrogenase
MTLKILAPGGDGIGPEVVDAALRVFDIAAHSINLDFDLSEGLLHGAAWEQYGCFIRPQTLDKARAGDALLGGTTGGPALGSPDHRRRPRRAGWLDEAAPRLPDRCRDRTVPCSVIPARAESLR